MEAEEDIKNRILGLDTHGKVKCIILFGSRAKKEHLPFSDIDIAVFYSDIPSKRFKFQMLAQGNLPDKVDLKIFQDLPLTLKKEVILGKILYCGDFQVVFDEFLKVIRDYEDFNRFYEVFLNEVREEAKV
ncbi:MAG: nucleotidyltransferase domain-containing protein [Nanoarchaeota archaeon]